jgi:hypothetical protein
MHTFAPGLQINVQLEDHRKHHLGFQPGRAKELPGKYRFLVALKLAIQCLKLQQALLSLGISVDRSNITDVVC